MVVIFMIKEIIIKPQGLYMSNEFIEVNNLYIKTNCQDSSWYYLYAIKIYQIKGCETMTLTLILCLPYFFLFVQYCFFIPSPLTERKFWPLF